MSGLTYTAAMAEQALNFFLYFYFNPKQHIWMFLISIFCVQNTGETLTVLETFETISFRTLFLYAN